MAMKALHLPERDITSSEKLRDSSSASCHHGQQGRRSLYLYLPHRRQASRLRRFTCSKPQGLQTNIGGAAESDGRTRPKHLSQKRMTTRHFALYGQVRPRHAEEKRTQVV
ncbi:unnamed protein product [Effrenium voratum]|nr:unnamed protein product [Effrenium voratum]